MLPPLVPYPRELTPGTGLRPYGGKDTCTVTLDPALPAEGYRLSITETGITLAAADPAGARHGQQTLLQLAAAGDTLPCLDIRDWPEYRWRGMHLDCSRHFFDVTFIKRYLDLLARHKMNRFHWHLCDDQGWRLESRAFPRLTEIGGWRERSVVGHTANRDREYREGRYGGYYTQDQVREVVAYAATLGIEVVPEIDIPGHAAALLAAYPALSCDHGDYRVEEHYGIFPDVLCPSEASFDFLTTLFAEVAALFPFEFVHIGGDEVIKDRWRDCPRCQQLMAAQGMASVDQLHGYFVQRVEAILAGLGRRAIGWDEVMDGDVSTATTIMCWTGFDACREALRRGHQTIMTPVACTYFDFYQSTSVDEPQAIHGLATLRQVFDYDPLPEGVDESLRANILGAQANVWSEYLTTPATVEQACLPRMSALAEVVWTGPQRRWAGFCERLPAWLALLEADGYRVSRAVYKPRFSVQPAAVGLEVDLASEFPGLALRYSDDGGTPGKPWQGLLHITCDTVLRGTALVEGEPCGDERLHLAVHKALHCPLFRWRDGALVPAPELARLTNGCLGLARIFHGFEWTAFEGEQADIVIDLGELQPVSSLAFNTEAGAHRRLFHPSGVTVSLAVDDLQWQPVARAEGAALATGSTALSWPEHRARYLRLQLENSDRHYSPEQRRPITRPVHIDELVVR